MSLAQLDRDAERAQRNEAVLARRSELQTQLTDTRKQLAELHQKEAKLSAEEQEKDAMVSLGSSARFVLNKEVFEQRKAELVKRFCPNHRPGMLIYPGTEKPEGVDVAGPTPRACCELQFCPSREWGIINSEVQHGGLMKDETQMYWVRRSVLVHLPSMTPVVGALMLDYLFCGFEGDGYDNSTYHVVQLRRMGYELHSTSEGTARLPGFGKPWAQIYYFNGYTARYHWGGVRNELLRLPQTQSSKAQFLAADIYGHFPAILDSRLLTAPLLQIVADYAVEGPLVMSTQDMVTYFEPAAKRMRTCESGPYTLSTHSYVNSLWKPYGI